MTAVRLTDRDSSQLGGVFMWMFEQDPDYGTDFLPESWVDDNQGAIHFDSADEADAWASDRALAWAREEAELPPLPALCPTDGQIPAGQ